MATVSVAEEYGFNFQDEPCEEFLFRKWPCRKCIPCLRRRQQEWVARLTEELRQHEGNYFVTLTYDEQSVPWDTETGLMRFDRPRIRKLCMDMRKRFQMRRLRNPAFPALIGAPEYLPLPEDVHFKYYITSEYCPTSTQRPHYHAVFYGLQVDTYTAEILFRLLWPEGFVTVYPALDGAAGYISKYLCKDVLEVDSYHSEIQDKPFQRQSNGLGKSYVDRMRSWHEADPYNRQYYQYHGEKKVLGRYYKQKLFSEEFRQEAAERYEADSMLLRGKYQKLREEHPLRYQRLMEERKKYFNDLRDNERFLMLKKQSM